MFNKKIYNSYVNQDPSSVNVEVTEHRAPTDESVRLLKEMEKEALDKLVGSVVTQNNVFDGVLHLFLQPANAGHTAVIRFVLNGRQFNYDVHLDRLHPVNQNELIKLLYTKIAEEISEDLVSNYVKNTKWMPK